MTGGEMMRVLIAIDDSACSRLAIDAVVNRHWADSTKFRVIHVVEPIVQQYGLVAPQAVELMIDAEKKLKIHGQQLLDATSAKLQSLFGAESVGCEVLQGNVSDTIVQNAIEWKADLIVIGSHGRTGIDRLFLGSVAEKVVNRAPCSVDVVKLKAVVTEPRTAKQVAAASI
jgi:nucleotide-binding universal stress UspA family protein